MALQLYQEVVAQGYTGSARTIRRTVAQFRPHGSKPVTKQMITWQKTPSPRNTALMIVRPAEKRTQDQTKFIDQLCKSDPTAATAYHLAQAFGSLLRNLEGKPGWEKWKAAVRLSGIPELIDFMEGLADDLEAVVNGCTASWNNGMVEGFINKVKWIKRSSTRCCGEIGNAVNGAVDGWGCFVHKASSSPVALLKQKSRGRLGSRTCKPEHNGGIGGSVGRSEWFAMLA